MRPLNVGDLVFCENTKNPKMDKLYIISEVCQLEGPRLTGKGPRYYLRCKDKNKSYYIDHVSLKECTWGYQRANE